MSINITSCKAIFLNLMAVVSMAGQNQLLLGHYAWPMTAKEGFDGRTH